MSTAVVTTSQASNLLLLEMAEERLTLADDLAGFIRASWQIIEPATEYSHNWHIDCLAEYLHCVRTGEITRLIVNMPPRNMKSTIVTVNFPCWWWATEPAERFICTSYGAALARDLSIKRRGIIESAWYQDRWGDIVRLAEDQNEKSNFKNTAEGAMLATSVGGSITGMGGNCIIIDDPINPADADSETERLAAIHYIERTLVSRLNDKKKGRMVLVMQRLHEKDPTGHELAKNCGWVHLKLPAIADKAQSVFFPKSKTTKQRPVDDILWPDREGKKELDMMRIAMTEVGFAGQYQQEPAPAVGAIFKREWWKYYGPGTGNALPDRFDLVVDSWDAAFKDKPTSDRVCGIKMGSRGTSIYLLDLTVGQMGFSESCLAIKNLAAVGKHRPNEILVEDKANGSAIVEVLSKEMFNIEAVNPQGGKVSRANAAQPTVKTGSVYLPQNAPWAQEFVEECARFTGKDGETDDQVDAFTQGIIRIVLKGGGIFAWVQQRYDEDSSQRGAQAEREKDAMPRASALANKTVESVANGSQMQCSREQYLAIFRKPLKESAAQLLEAHDVRGGIIAAEVKRLDALFKITIQESNL